MLQFIKGKHPTERKNSWDKKHLCLSQVLLNTWKLILLYSVAAGLSAKPSLQEALTSLDNLKDNRACWFLYSVHTRTGNRLLTSTQPPQLCYCSHSYTHSVLKLIFEDSVIHVPGTITHFPHNTTNFPEGVFCLSVQKTQPSPRSALVTL